MLKAFHGTRERYFKMLFAELVEFFIYFAITAAMVAPFALLYIPPFFTLVGNIFVSIMSTAALITCFFVSFNYAFVPFVASKNKDTDFSDYLYNSRISVRGLRGMLFGEYLVTYLLGEFWFELLIALPFLFIPFGQIPTLVVAIISVIGVFIVYVLLVAPMNFKRILFVYMLGEDACKTSQSIVVKRRASSRVEYDPLFDQPVKNDALDINN
jgi:hypothetical protein